MIDYLAADVARDAMLNRAFVVALSVEAGHQPSAYDVEVFRDALATWNAMYDGAATDSATR